ncbi:hypothetical protein SJAG_01217 [Schizosaccharomyces japonicus yFS275]|uniref:Uncharacterized protein n=1 Tax=Schizosaccharomyces japonicus (strain yFS275 / FY16936) TaxID=402676 RepID=B6K028_SCHJY|nr:hypothetical protein SJAG_01217 [Schizosaccharomyces japonicus yFS275]EEB06178.1 hypothetical protein SJAG_01217 [Schizosaccharomyces japonicus yFS275]
MTEDDITHAAKQRKRTLFFLQRMAVDQPHIRVDMHDKTEHNAQFLAIDSSDSKLAVRNLETDWGVIDKAVLRTGDITCIHFRIQKEEGEL